MSIKTDETSTTKVENVGDGQPVSEAAERIPNAQTRSRAVSERAVRAEDVKRKPVGIRQKVDRDRARWSRLVCEWFR